MSTTPPAVVKPRRLQRGDRVAVLSPASPLRDDARKALDQGMDWLRGLGLKPALGRHALQSDGYLAGTDAQRAADLQTALRDPDVRGIFCVRGGYGVTRLLEDLDLSALAADPKPIVGYSDITALLAAAFGRHGVIGLHGPMVATTKAYAMGKAMQQLQANLLFDPTRAPRLPESDLGPGPHVLNPGRAESRLVGGNLSLVCALLGTPDQIDTRGRLLLLEDVGEAPYRVDRMLTQLRHGGHLQQAAGILLGDFHREDTPLASEDAATTRVLEERLGGLDVPVVTGLPFGHRPESWTLPIGALARLDARDRAARPTLTLLESPVSD